MSGPAFFLDLRSTKHLREWRRGERAAGRSAPELGNLVMLYNLVVALGGRERAAVVSQAYLADYADATVRAVQAWERALQAAGLVAIEHEEGARRRTVRVLELEQVLAGGPAASSPPPARVFHNLPVAARVCTNRRSELHEPPFVQRPAASLERARVSPQGISRTSSTDPGKPDAGGAGVGRTLKAAARLMAECQVWRSREGRVHGLAQVLAARAGDEIAARAIDRLRLWSERFPLRNRGKVVLKALETKAERATSRDRSRTPRARSLFDAL